MNKININKNEYFFLIGWLLFDVTNLFDLTTLFSTSGQLTFILKLVRYVGYLIFAINILFQVINQKKVFCLLIFFVISLITMFNSSTTTMFLYALIFFAANKVNSKKIMKLTLITHICIVFSTVILSQIGVLQDYLFVRNEELSIYRHSLGFTWTTTAPILFFYTTLIYFYLKKEKIDLLLCFFFEIIAIWFYVKTNTRMVFFLESITITFMIIQRINKSRWKFFSKLKKIYIYFPSIICLIIIFIFKCFNEKSNLWLRINNLFSDRLALGANAISKYGFTFLGQKIEWIGYNINNLSPVGYNYVDCSYLQLCLNYGFLFLIAVIFIYSIILFKAIYCRDFYLITIILIILLFSITEPRLMNLAFNPFPLLAFCSIEKKYDAY